MQSSQPGKPMRDSQVEMIQLVLPNDANGLGNLLGGTVMHWIDLAAAMAAVRHARRVVVTASVDRLDFRLPIRVGEFCILKANVNYTGRSSMEVGVKVFGEHPLTGEQRHTSTAYLTFVALDESGQPTEIPDVIPETEEDRRRYAEAQERRAQRLRSRPGKEVEG
jgi:acyl-CoA hydrolase